MAIIMKNSGPPISQTIMLTPYWPLKHQTKIAADDIFNFLLLSFEENKAWFFMWILCLAEDSLETSSHIFSEKQWKDIHDVVCCSVTGALRVEIKDTSPQYEVLLVSQKTDTSGSLLICHQNLCLITIVDFCITSKLAVYRTLLSTGISNTYTSISLTLQPYDEWIDGWFAILRLFQQFFSHIRMMGRW